MKNCSNQTNYVTPLTSKEVLEITGGFETISLSNDAYPILLPDTDCGISPINPDGTLNKNIGWCGSGPGGQGIHPF